VTTASSIAEAKLRIDEYKRRDYRVKCIVCRRWMQHRPRGQTTLLRRPSPHAGHCVECPLPGDKTDPMVLLAQSAIERAKREHCTNPETCNPDKGSIGCVCKCPGCRYARRTA
jgi:hypothetical protein